MAPPTPPDAPIEEEEDAHAGELPLTMAASVVLDHLPRDAHQALEGAGELALAKGLFVSFLLPWQYLISFTSFLCYSRDEEFGRRGGRTAQPQSHNKL